MLKKINYLIIALFIIVFAIFYYQRFSWQSFVKDHQVVNLVLKDNFLSSSAKTLKVEIVNTPESVSEGLSNRSDLINHDGEQIDALLFIFPKAAVQHFWMKEMNFNIDICWLEKTEIISCVRNVPKPKPGQDLEDLPIYSSPQAVEMVLETLPGFLTNQDLQKKLFLSFR